VGDGGPGLTRLDADECWALLGHGHVGRIALEDEDTIVIVPVNYAVDGTVVVFRTQEENLLGRAASWGRRVAFQVDHLDPDAHTGWTVLARGELRRADEQETERLAALVSPWAGGERPVVGRIVVARIDGRRVGPS